MSSIKDKAKTAEEIYEANRPKFHDWGTLKQMCLASMQEYADQQVAKALSEYTKSEEELINALRDIDFVADHVEGEKELRKEITKITFKILSKWKGKITASS